MPALPCLSLARVLALLGGTSLAAAFFMPWFSSQGLLLSGQFLHIFLGNPGDLRRFVPGTTGAPGEAQALRALVDLFLVCGLLAMLTTLIGGLAPRGRWPANILLGLTGLVPLLAWAIGIGRLPAGANPEIGLWLIAVGSLAVLVGLAGAVIQERAPGRG